MSNPILEKLYSFDPQKELHSISSPQRNLDTLRTVIFKFKDGTEDKWEAPNKDHAEFMSWWKQLRQAQLWMKQMAEIPYDPSTH